MQRGCDVIQGGSCMPGLQPRCPETRVLEGSWAIAPTARRGSREGQKAVSTRTELEDFCSFLFTVIKDTLLFF